MASMTNNEYFREGYQAAQEGLSKQDNPYDLDSGLSEIRWSSFCWLLGYSKYNQEKGVQR